jgi:hypothetical protein
MSYRNYYHARAEYLDGAMLSHIFNISLGRITIRFGFSRNNLYLGYNYFPPMRDDAFDCKHCGLKGGH